MSYERQFKERHKIEDRMELSQKLCKKYPERVPIIVSRGKETSIQPINKNKFVAPRDISIGRFIYEIRKQIKMTPEESLYLFIGKTLPSSSALIEEIYNKYSDPDGFLYITYHGENTFGS